MFTRGCTPTSPMVHQQNRDHITYYSYPCNNHHDHQLHSPSTAAIVVQSSSNQSGNRSIFGAHSQNFQSFSWCFHLVLSGEIGIFDVKSQFLMVIYIIYIYIYCEAASLQQQPPAASPLLLFPPMAQSAPLPTAGGEPIVAAKVQMVNNLPDM